MLDLLHAAVALVPLLVTGDIALVRIDPDHAGLPLWLHSHAEGQSASDVVGSLRASDNSFFKAGGSKPVRWVFPAQWDGDGAEEIVVVRERKKSANHALDLRIHRMPATTGGSVALVASVKSGGLGGTLGNGRIVAVGPVDLEADGTDELAIVREWNNGDRYLEIRRLPTGKQKALSPPIAFDATFGSAADGAIVGVFGADVDADFHDELMVVHRSATGLDRIDGYELPTFTGADTGPPRVSCADVTPADGGTNTSVSRIRLDGAEVDALMFSRRGADGVDRIEIFAMPTSLGATLGAPIASDATLALGSFAVPVFAAFGFDTGAEPPPWVAFNGPWELYLRVRYGGPETTEEWDGPFGGFTGAANANSTLTLTFPNSTLNMVAHLASFDDGAATDFGEDPWYTTREFLSSVSSGVVRPNDKLLVTYTDGEMHFGSNGRPYLSGVAPESWVQPYIGEVQQAPDYVNATGIVFEYKFVKN